MISSWMLLLTIDDASTCIPIIIAGPYVAWFQCRRRTRNEVAGCLASSEIDDQNGDSA